VFGVSVKTNKKNALSLIGVPMPTATHKLTCFYNQLDRGWTETYYVSGTDTFQLAENPGSGFIPAILGTKISDVILVGIRANSLTQKRDSHFSKQGLPGTQQISGDSSPDVTTTAALVLLTGTATFNGTNVYRVRRHIWLRGLDDSQVVRNDRTGAAEPGPLLNPGLSRLFRAMRGNAPPIFLQVLSKDYTAFPWFQVIGITPDAVVDSQSDVTYLSNVPIPKDASLYFRGIPQNDMPGLRGYFPVLSTLQGATNNIQIATIPYRYRSHRTTYTPPNAFVRQHQYVYAPVSTAEFETFGERDTGRPTTRFRGRGRITVRRQ